jgi:2-C-methyl-D-erythritol 2,4-cyclodiphosphate synthase
MFRIGIGNDVHRLAAGRALVLGGVHVESEVGAEGHSDADALTHAVTDAILGAICEGDIGVHFPDRDPRWKDADSIELLARVVWLAKGAGFRVGNVDATVMLERPKLRPYVQQMREKLAAVLETDVGCVSVKAKTGEGLDAVGEGRAVRAQAVVLLEHGG